MSLYKKAFQLSKLNGTVKDLRYLEQTFNDKNGSRYLLELDIQLHQKTVHTSEYVYLNKNSTHLCHTSNFQWAEATHVYLAVSGVCVCVCVWRGGSCVNNNYFSSGPLQFLTWFPCSVPRPPPPCSFS